MNSGFNVRHAAVLSLGSSSCCWKKIKEIYEKNELYYYEKYRNSEMSKDILKEMYPAIDLEHINMLIGIVEDAYIKNNFEQIDLIIKTLNPHILKYLKNKTIVNIDDYLNLEFFNNKYKKKVGTGIFFDENFSEEIIFKEAAILIYLAKRNHQEISGIYISRLISHFELLENSILVQLKSNTPSNDEYEKMNILKDQLELTNEYINRQENLATFFENMIEYKVEQDIMREIGEKTFKAIGTHIELYDKIRSKVFQQGIYKYIGTYTIFTPLFGMESNISMTNIPINSNIIDKILYSCINAVKNNHIPDSEIQILFISEIFMYAILYQYNQLKEKYLHSEKDKYYDDITKLRDDLTEKYKIVKEKEELLDNENREKEKNILNKSNEINKLRNELRQFQKEKEKNVKELEKCKQDLNERKQECNILYELLENNQNADDNEEISLNEKIDFINRKKIALIGGNKTTLKQLTGALSELTILEKSTSDITSIIQCNAIFINYQWLKHSLSYKIWSLAKKENIPFYYVTGTNTEKVIDQIYSKLLDCKKKCK